MEPQMEIKKLKLEIRNTATSAELGEWLGLSSKAVASHASGVLVRGKARGTYHLKQSVKNYCDHIRRMASGRESDAVKQRRRLIRSQADFAETRAQIESGALVATADVLERWSGTFRTVRAQAMAIPSRAAAQLPHLSRGDVIVIDDIIRARLTVAGTYKNDDETEDDSSTHEGE